MSKSWLPVKDSELYVWSQNYRALIVAGPSEYGLDDAASDAINAAVDGFALAYQTANDPMTRSPGNIEIKRSRKAALVLLVRQQVKRIQGWSGINDDKRRALGIHVPDSSRTPSEPPTMSPRIEVVGVDGHRVSLRIMDEEGRRRKPAGVIGFNLFLFVGETPSTDVNAWVPLGGETKLELFHDFETSMAVGTKVWFTAQWLNRKLEAGPACVPVMTRINYGGLSMAA